VVVNVQLWKREAESAGTWLKRVMTRVLIPYWERRKPAEWTTPGRRYSEAPSDNVQQTMNLIMPLAHNDAATAANLAMYMRLNADNLYTGLDVVGTVHFARFDIIDGNLSMVSVYDGDFETYIRDFIAAIGDVFDVLMTFVKDPPPTPVGQYPSQFVEWVNEHDLLQVPDDPTELVDDLDLLPRRLLLLFNENPQMQLGIYRAYPGSSVAQIRRALGLEWGKRS
jgi:hypothetical protein